MKVAEYVFSFLRAKGAQCVFFVSGGGNMHLIDALARAEGVKAVPMHHEQACAMAVRPSRASIMSSRSRSPCRCRTSEAA